MKFIKQLIIHKRVVFLFFLILSFITLLQSQQIVTGTVVAEDGKAVEDVTIRSGVNSFATTDANGNFSIQLDDGYSVLVFSVIGFTTIEKSIPDSVEKMQVTLLHGTGDETSLLNAIVVTGYGTEYKREISSSVSVVKPSELASIPNGQVEQLLQGRAAGVNVITSGQPGSLNQVQIRGVSNFGDVTPLYIIDGVQGDINNINPNEIESIQILKDASAAIYGVRGSNGVIVITTKKGKVGRQTITYDGYVGVTTPLAEGYDLLSPQDWAQLKWNALSNTHTIVNGETTPVEYNDANYGSGATPVLPDYLVAGDKVGTEITSADTDIGKYNTNYSDGEIYQITKANKSGTDYFHEIFKPAFVQSHTISIAGASNKANYLFSAGYLDQQGTLLHTKLTRYNVRANTAFKILNDRVTLGENVQVLYIENPLQSIQNEGGPIAMQYRTQTIIPVYDEGGGFAGTRGSGLGNSSNPVAMLERSKDNITRSYQIFGNVFADLKFFDGLNFRTTFGGTINSFYRTVYNYHTYERSENNASNSLRENSGFANNYTWTNMFTFNKTFANNHRVKVLAGTEKILYTLRELEGYRNNFITDDPNFRVLSAGNAGSSTNTSATWTTTIFSLIGKVGYSFKGTYNIDATVRRDGASVFEEDEKYGMFSSASASWVMSNEEFFAGIHDVLSFLKLRASWGTLGYYRDVPITNQYYSYNGTAANSEYDITEPVTSVQPGLRLDAIGEGITSWQENEILNIGFEAGFLANMFLLELDWYTKTTTGSLSEIQVPAYFDGATKSSVNGDIKNTGLDIMLGYNKTFSNGLNIRTQLAVTTYNNNIEKISGNTDYFFTTEASRIGDIVRNEVGNSISSFYGYQIDGFFDNQAEVDNSATQNAAAIGRFKYKDINGDGQIREDDKTFIGDPNPDFTYSLNLSASYKNFDVTMFFYGSQGNDIFNYTKYWLDFYSSFQGAKSSTALNNSWTPTNKNAKVSIAESVGTFSSNGVINSYYVEDGSYLRCKSLTVGYTFPKEMLTVLNIAKLRVYFQVLNLFTLTGYTGLDPELLSANLGGSRENAAFGIDYGTYPNNQKQYTLGVSLGL